MTTFSDANAVLIGPLYNDKPETIDRLYTLTPEGEPDQVRSPWQRLGVFLEPYSIDETGPLRRLNGTLSTVQSRLLALAGFPSKLALVSRSLEDIHTFRITNFSVATLQPVPPDSVEGDDESAVVDVVFVVSDPEEVVVNTNPEGA